eukprot:CAMPEP_0180786778 /NCGR_PEP_ID=MMETSP1038_2-20121128/50999_1 /TAXON_ID=632150 /ORGANISM="Azadinium spinosum, Strain 3D9" /LENGTH=53 /DNA_ID=CAMNT_0022823957 /DNA_START=655 /DNA_END=816 /DNA_ORIENTATION=-
MTRALAYSKVLKIFEAQNGKAMAPAEQPASTKDLSFAAPRLRFAHAKADSVLW